MLVFAGKDVHRYPQSGIEYHQGFARQGTGRKPRQFLDPVLARRNAVAIQFSIANIVAQKKSHAPNVIVFLDRQILREGFGWFRGIDRAREPASLSVVFTREEKRAVLARLNEVRCMMGSLVYGFGLRLM